MRQCSTLLLPKTRLKCPRAVSGVVTPSALVKAAIVSTLGWVLAWRPSTSGPISGGRDNEHAL